MIRYQYNKSEHIVEAEFDRSEQNISEAIESITKLSNQFHRISVAIVQTSPLKTAYSLLFKNVVNIINYTIEIFYSKRAALNWIKTTEFPEKNNYFVPVFII